MSKSLEITEPMIAAIVIGYVGWLVAGGAGFLLAMVLVGVFRFLFGFIQTALLPKQAEQFEEIFKFTPPKSRWQRWAEAEKVRMVIAQRRGEALGASLASLDRSCSPDVQTRYLEDLDLARSLAKLAGFRV